MKRSEQKKVLVGVLKNKNDLRLLLRDHWYRIPIAFAPRRRFTYIAFYQPALFGRQGKRILYYARVSGKSIVERVVLLPNEPRHPRAHDAYLKITFRRVQQLPKPIRNIIPRRVSFGFVSMQQLLNAENILELYGVPATEQIVAAYLRRRGITTVAEHTVSSGGRRCRIDLVVRCRKGAIAIECDNRKAHSSAIQKRKDKSKDLFLKRLGWRVVRLKEKDILEDAGRCASRVQKAVRTLCGQTQ